MFVNDFGEHFPNGVDGDNFIGIEFKFRLKAIASNIPLLNAVGIGFV
jgi:hypothetical protein